MKFSTRLTRRFGHVLRKTGEEIEKRAGLQGIWIDVGAHCGETTLQWAALNPGLKVYAFEPNLPAATKLMGRVSNCIVIPMAVSENDGTADFHVNALGVASSLLPLNESAARSWIGGDGLKVTSVVTVPTMRLDTFMELAGVGKVDFLKIDAQGGDLAVVRSAGSRLKDIHKVTLEADITPTRLYQGSSSRAEIVAYMEHHGFMLAETETQSSGQEENITFIRKSVGVR